jgi:hypothetical protein
MSKGFTRSRQARLPADFLNENDTVGIVDPTYNAPCISAATVTAVNPFPYVAAPGSRPRTALAIPGTYQQNNASNPNAPNIAFYPYYNSRSWRHTT